MDKFYLLGYPLSHSYSPKIYERLFKSLNKVASYSLLPTKCEELKERILWIKLDKDVLGFNLTQPLKEEVIKYIDVLDELSKEIGSVNTVLVKDEKLYGFNTDYTGFKKSIEPFLNEIEGNTALVFGSGGAAKPVIKALVDVNVKSVFVANRTFEKALKIKEMFGNKVIPVKLEEVESVISNVKIVINATTVGLNGNETLIKSEWINKDMILYDLIYNPEKTEFLKIGAKIGAKIKNGYDMLYFQCLENVKIWYGGFNAQVS